MRRSARPSAYSGAVKLGGPLVLALGVTVLPAQTPPLHMETTTNHARPDIEAIVNGFRGVMGVYAVNLRKGGSHEEIAVNADARFPTASTIKTAVMVEAYQQQADGRLPFDTVLTVGKADKVGGSGVLRDMHDGFSLTVADALQLMISLSDNIATNLLIGRVGTADVDARLDAYGLKNTRLFRPTFRDGRADVLPELEREFGLGMTTPREMATLMARIAEGEAVNPAASAAMLATLRRQQDRAMIPRLLGDDEEKRPGPTGRKGHVRADAAIVTGPKGFRYVIAIYARQVEDTRWTIENDALTTGARISKRVYVYFAGR